MRRDDQMRDCAGQGCTSSEKGNRDRTAIIAVAETVSPNSAKVAASGAMRERKTAPQNQRFMNVSQAGFRPDFIICAHRETNSGFPGEAHALVAR